MVFNTHNAVFISEHSTLSEKKEDDVLQPRHVLCYSDAELCSNSTSTIQGNEYKQPHFELLLTPTTMPTSHEPRLQQQHKRHVPGSPCHLWIDLVLARSASPYSLKPRFLLLAVCSIVCCDYACMFSCAKQEKVIQTVSRDAIVSSFQHLCCKYTSQGGLGAGEPAKPSMGYKLWFRACSWSPIIWLCNQNNSIDFSP